MNERILVRILVGLACVYALTACSERCIPFKEWAPAVEESSNRFEACIEPNVECEARQKKDPKVKCVWALDCKMTCQDNECYALAGYPDRHLVCENDCSLSALGWCLVRR